MQAGQCCRLGGLRAGRRGGEEEGGWREAGGGAGGLTGVESAVVEIIYIHEYLSWVLAQEFWSIRKVYI